MPTPHAGLRQRKKAQTRRLIAETAMSLFAARGFDRVTVAEVAAAAEVATTTVFNYFPTKEDLFYDRQDEVVGHLGHVVRHRAPGESFVAACRRDMLELIAAGIGAPVLRATSRAFIAWSATAPPYRRALG